VVREILDKEGQKLYDRLAEMIPGFNPVLDEAALTVYVTLLQDQERLAGEIEAAEAGRRKQILCKMLAEKERQIQDWAVEHGLTPASGLEILRKERVRGGGD